MNHEYYEVLTYNKEEDIYVPIPENFWSLDDARDEAELLHKQGEDVRIIAYEARVVGEYPKY